MAHTTRAHFTPKLFAFLRDLAENNRREWFQANKDRYENDVREPSRRFISDFGPLLEKVSPHFSADPRTVGGSLFRIHRDTRFSHDKTPYKTHTGIQFRHKQGKDVHAPGFYLHLAPREVFVGVGIWHPDAPALREIRRTIDEDPAAWRQAHTAKRFVAAGYELAGDRLKRSPKGYDPDHPWIDDLKRKDFIAVKKLSQAAVTRPTFLTDFASLCRDGAPLAEFLCRAVDVGF